MVQKSAKMLGQSRKPLDKLFTSILSGIDASEWEIRVVHVDLFPGVKMDLIYGIRC